MSRGKVVVIGCGPAGLAAAHAATGLDYSVRILAPREKRPQRGPLLMQRPIPGINDSHPDGYVKQIVVGGSILDYRYKLYGDINININGDILEDGYHAWKMQETYNKLWCAYSGLIEDSVVTRADLRLLARDSKLTLVVNTAPAINFCNDGHTFDTKRVVLTQKTSYPDQPDNTIIFNAQKEVSWVRSSLIFGHEVTEWPPGESRNLSDKADYEGESYKPFEIAKPIHTNCDCYPNVLRTGRFGAWRNETWVDTAYYETRSSLILMDNNHVWERIK